MSAIYTRTGRYLMIAWVAMSCLRRPREWPAFKLFIEGFFGAAARKYFPLSLHAEDYWAGMRKHEDSNAAVAVAATAKRPPLLFNISPHGQMSVHTNFLIAMSGLWTKEKLPPIRMLVGAGFWYLPFFREWMSWFGNLPVSPKVVRRAFQDKMDLGLVPGGFEEAVLANPGTNELFQMGNYGWVKHALRHGYGVVPAFCFGENELKSQWKGYKLQRARFAGKYKIPLVFPTSMGIKQHPIALVVGAPVWFPCLQDPTKEELKEWHGRYIEAVRALYDKHKAAHGAADIPLTIY